MIQIFQVTLMSMPVNPLTLSLVLSLVSLSTAWAGDAPEKAAPPTLKAGTFEMDATPPFGFLLGMP